MPTAEKMPPQPELKPAGPTGIRTTTPVPRNSLRGSVPPKRTTITHAPAGPSADDLLFQRAVDAIGPRAVRAASNPRVAALQAVLGATTGIPEAVHAVRTANPGEIAAAAGTQAMNFFPLGRFGSALRGLSEAERAVQAERAAEDAVQAGRAARTFTSGDLAVTQPAAKSRSGRLVENVLDNHREALSKVGLMNSPDEKVGRVLGQRIKTKADLATAPGDALLSITSRPKWSRAKDYALRVMSEHSLPGNTLSVADRRAFHLRAAETASDTMSAAYHRVHARLIGKASKFLAEHPDGSIGLKADAPKDLHDAWRLLQKTAHGREQVYRDIGRLNDVQIANRVHAPGRVFQGAQWMPNEQVVRNALESNPARAELHQAIDQALVQPIHEAAARDTEGLNFGPDIANATASAQAAKDAIDASARAYAEQQAAHNGTDPLAAVDELFQHLKGATTEAPAGEHLAQIEPFHGESWQGPGGAAEKNLIAKQKGLEKGLGLHGNERFMSVKGHPVVGRITPQEWVQRVLSVMKTKAERNAWARWYATFEPAFRSVFGADADPLMRAFAVSQANDSPAGGLQAALRIFDDIARGIPVDDKAYSVVGGSIRDAIRGLPIEKSVAAKLSDFIDALRQSDVRTWMGHAEEGGMPAPSDVHAARDSGLVDPKELGYLEKEHGLNVSHLRRDLMEKELNRLKNMKQPEKGELAKLTPKKWEAHRAELVAKQETKLAAFEKANAAAIKEGRKTGLKIDNMNGSPSGNQYERVSEWYHEITDHLNEIRFDGRSNWTPAEAQALGWAAIQKFHGVEPEDFPIALARNSRTFAVQGLEGPHIASLVKSENGFPIRYGTGWVEAVISPEAATRVAQRLADEHGSARILWLSNKSRARTPLLRIKGDVPADALHALEGAGFTHVYPGEETLLRADGKVDTTALSRIIKEHKLDVTFNGKVQEDVRLAEAGARAGADRGGTVEADLAGRGGEARGGAEAQALEQRQHVNWSDLGDQFGHLKGAYSHDSVIHLIQGHADVSTVVHEWAHHMVSSGALVGHAEDVAARWAGADLVKGADGEKHWVWDTAAHEKFARGLEQWAREGNGPSPLKAAWGRIAKDMRETVDQADLPDVSPQMRRIFDRLFTFNKAKGGSLVGAEDFHFGANYVPYVPGAPVALGREARLFGSYIRHRLQLFNPGSRTALGRGPDDAALSHAFTGALIRSGFFKADVGRASTAALHMAWRVASAKLARDAFLQASEELPRGADWIAMKVDPTINTPDELKAYWERLHSVSGDGTQLSAHDLAELTSEEDVNQFISEMFPAEVGGEATKQVAARLSAQVGEDMKTLQEPIENIRWFPKELLDASGLTQIPGAQKLALRGLTKQQRAAAQAVGLAFDAFNDIQRAGLLILSPAYIPVNLLGNVAMNVLQQGPLAFPNLYRAVMLHRALELEDRVAIDKVMGRGVFQAVMAFHLPGPGQIINHTLGHWASIAVDLAPRRAAFLHEARKLGYKSPDDLRRLLHDPASFDDLMQVKQHANEAIVDYERLSPFEQNIVSRAVFVYPWLKGATHYSIRFAVNHPIETMALSMMADHAVQQSNSEIGPRPYYAQLDVPVSTGSLGFSIPGVGGVGLDQLVGEHEYRNGRGFPETVNPKQLLTQTTVTDLAEAAAGTLGLEGKANANTLAGNIAPGWTTLATWLTGYDPNTHKEVPAGQLSTLRNSIMENFTAATKIKAIQSADPNSVRKLYPRSKTEAVESMFLGRLAPAPENPKTAAKVAHGKTGMTPKQHAQGRMTVVRQELGSVPPEVISAEHTKVLYDDAQKALVKQHNVKGLSVREQTELKLHILASAHPEYAGAVSQLVSTMQQNVDPKVYEAVSRWAEKTLGWTTADKIESEAKKLKQSKAVSHGG